MREARIRTVNLMLSLSKHEEHTAVATDAYAA